jgi:outer membrane protein assembly factor BamB
LVLVDAVGSQTAGYPVGPDRTGWIHVVAERFRQLAMLLLLVACCFLSAVAQSSPPACSWPEFRGENSTGATQESVVEAQHNGLRIAWSASIPGTGHSSPVVCDDTVYVSTSYINHVGAVVFSMFFWIAALAITVSAWLIFAKWTRHPPSTGRASAIAMRIGLLFLFSLVGNNLFACPGDHLRTAILSVLIVSAALDAVRLVTADWRPAQWTVAFAGILLAAAAVCLTLSFPSHRQLGIRVSFALTPLVCTFLCFRTLYPKRGCRIAATALSVMMVLVALLTVVRKAQRTSGGHFWTIQPTRPLQLSAGYLLCCGGFLVTGLLLGGGRTGNHGRMRVAATVLVAWGGLLAVPVLAAPLVNSFEYLRYHLIRGQFASPLGMSGFWAVAGVLLLGNVMTPCLPAQIRTWLTRLAGQHGVIAGALLLGGGTSAALGVLGISPGGFVCAILALDAQTGRLRWMREGLSGQPMPKGSGWNSPATPTPVVMDQYVVGYFGERGAFACRLDNGEQVWTYQDLPYTSDYGAASSMTRGNSSVIVHSASEPSSGSVYVTALAMDNGRPEWKHSYDDIPQMHRERDHGPAWRSPVAFPWRGRLVICVWGRLSSEFLDARTGRLLSSLLGIETGFADPVLSPVVAGTACYFAGPERLFGVSIGRLIESPHRRLRLLHGGGNALARQDDAVGITADLHVELDGEGPNVCTPAVIGERLFTVSDMGTLLCISLPQARVIWKTEVGKTQSSPIIAGKHLFITNARGLVRAFDVSRPQPTLLGTLSLGESVRASPAVAKGRLFVRGQSSLHCIVGDAH